MKIGDKVWWYSQNKRYTGTIVDFKPGVDRWDQEVEGEENAWIYDGIHPDLEIVHTGFLKLQESMA